MQERLKHVSGMYSKSLILLLAQRALIFVLLMDIPYILFIFSYLYIYSLKSPEIKQTCFDLLFAPIAAFYMKISKGVRQWYITQL